jgi:hypothetical protein
MEPDGFNEARFQRNRWSGVRKLRSQCRGQGFDFPRLRKLVALKKVTELTGTSGWIGTLTCTTRRSRLMPDMELTVLR